MFKWKLTSLWLDIETDISILIYSERIICKTAAARTKQRRILHSSGEIFGVDLKMVRPPDGKRWVMMVMVCFTSNRVWAFDLDEDKLLGNHTCFLHVCGVGIRVFCLKSLLLGFPFRVVGFFVHDSPALGYF